MIASVRALVLVGAFGVVAMAATAQQANLNLEGVIRDSVTGKAIGCKMFIWTPSGKRISISSNSKDGTYLQTLSEPGPHKIACTGYNVYRKEVVVEIPKADKFKIVKHDINVREVVEGTQIASVMNAFDRNAATLTPAGKAAVDQINELLRSNGEMNLVVTIAPDEDQLGKVKAQVDAAYAKELDAWKKAVKKVKKGQPAPPEPVRPADPADPNTDLVAQRIAAVKELTKAVKMGDVRISYVAGMLATPASAPVATPAATPAKGKGKTPAAAAKTAAPAAPAMPTLVIKLGKVKKLYE
jgi:outer membrane protein OmpA-like peptidoglycan-associated protein